MIDAWSDLVNRHLKVVACCESLGPAIIQTTKILRKSLDSGGKIILCGNGGSAAHAQHLAAELVVRFKRNRAPLAAIALGCNPAIVSATLNDLGCEEIFARELLGVAGDHDCVVGITTSGRSKNVLKALVTAFDHGIPTIAITGMHGIQAPVLHEIRVPSDDTARVQEIHQLIVHALAEALDE